MRKDYLDIAKGCGILLVVIGHALEIGFDDGADFAAWKFIYSFHMPLFFVLAGIATPRLAGTRFEKTLSAALTLIIVATALQLLFAPLQLALAREALPDPWLRVLWPAVKFEGYGLVVIWFLPCLAFVRLSAWYIANGLRPGLILVGLAVLCVVEQVLGVGYFQFRSVIVGLGFFAVGQRLSNVDRLPRAAHWGAFVAGLALVALSFDANHGCSFHAMRTCASARSGPFAVLMVSGAFGFLPLFALTALAGAAAVLGASLLLTATSAAPWLASLGRRTLEVLVVNGFALVLVQPWLMRTLGGRPGWAVIAGLVLLQLAVAAALHPLLARCLDLARALAAYLFSRTPRSMSGQSPASPRR